MGKAFWVGHPLNSCQLNGSYNRMGRLSARSVSESWLWPQFTYLYVKNDTIYPLRAVVTA